MNITDCVFELGKLQKENAALKQRVKHIEKGYDELRTINNRLQEKIKTENAGLRERMARLVEEMEFARVCILGCEGDQALTDRMAQAIADAKVQ